MKRIDFLATDGIVLNGILYESNQTTKKRKKSNAPRTKAVYKEKKLTNATNKKQNKTTKKGKRMTATSSRKLGNNNNKNGKRVK